MQPAVVTHRLGRTKSPLFLIFSSLSHFLVKPMTLYYSKIKSSKSKSAHTFWIGWLINEKSGCLCLRNSVLIYQSLRYSISIRTQMDKNSRNLKTQSNLMPKLPNFCSKLRFQHIKLKNLKVGIYSNFSIVLIITFRYLSPKTRFWLEIGLGIPSKNGSVCVQLRKRQPQ